MKVISSMCQQLETWAAEVGKPKKSNLVQMPDNLERVVYDAVSSELGKLYRYYFHLHLKS